MDWLINWFGLHEGMEISSTQVLVQQYQISIITQFWHIAALLKLISEVIFLIIK
jgi:hypothetical protein